MCVFVCEKSEEGRKMSIDRKAKIETNINQFVLKYDFIEKTACNQEAFSYFLRVFLTSDCVVHTKIALFP